jgi:hypothetical protein
MSSLKRIAGEVAVLVVDAGSVDSKQFAVVEIELTTQERETRRGTQRDCRVNFVFIGFFR